MERENVRVRERQWRIVRPKKIGCKRAKGGSCEAYCTDFSKTICRAQGYLGNIGSFGTAAHCKPEYMHFGYESHYIRYVRK